jgi:tRNA A-37 threonylcarbamoyl transferase component Bud32
MIMFDMNPREVLAQLDPELIFVEQYKTNPTTAVYEGEIVGLRKTFTPGISVSDYKQDISADVSAFFPKALELVDQLHQRGICRLVLTPENLLLHDSQASLFDFDEVLLEENIPATIAKKCKELDFNQLKRYLS